MRVIAGERLAMTGAIAVMITGVCFAKPTRGNTAASSGDLATVHRVTFQPRYGAYGQVQPIHDITLRSQLRGILAKLTVVPGGTVKQGQVIALITGPTHQAAIEQAKASVAHARAQLKLAEQLKQGIDQLPQGLETKPKIEKAANAVTQARSDLASATAQLGKLHAAAEIKAPAAGVVVAIQAANGERVAAGDAVINMQPADKLWLKADYYGSDIAEIHPGMKGIFHPADGGAPIAVTLLHLVPPQQADGAVDVVCLPASHSPAGWRNGAAGRLDLLGKKQSVVSVPTSSLIMDQGRWWTLVHDAQGDHPHVVTIGPSRGESTLIIAGLKPGQKVVVHDAYLRYHRDFSKQYTPPD